MLLFFPEQLLAEQLSRMDSRVMQGYEYRRISSPPRVLCPIHVGLHSARLSDQYAQLSDLYGVYFHKLNYSSIPNSWLEVKLIRDRPRGSIRIRIALRSENV
jgi:hypothetical protein